MAVNKNNVKIHVEHLEKTFGKIEVLKDISNDIYEGEVVVVIGPSGSGKSTFLRCLNRLEQPTDGTIIVDGFDISDKKVNINKVRENIGMVFQHFNLFNNLNVLQNLMLAPVDVKKMTKEEAKEKAKKALGLVGLDESYYSQSPFELSGGQKRRVAIAGVLAMRPKVLVLDEPTAGLDPKGRDEILDQIAYLHKESDLTVILVSHSMEDIARYADRLIVMNSGEVMYNDTPKNVFAHYQELEKVGLAAPQVTYIMHDLKMKGFPVGVTATTVEEAADEIMHALGRQ